MSESKRLIWLFAWLIVGVEAYKSGCSGGYCFVISDYTNDSERLDQSTAQQWCRSNGTQLVEIRNNDIQNHLVNFLRSVYLNNRNVTTNGKRSGGHWIRLNGNGIGSIRVYDQPDTSYAYGYLKSTTSGFDLFASRPTYYKEGFICTGPSDCSGGVTISGQCYKSFTRALSWYDARNRCLLGGGDLASFDHITTNAGFNALNGSWINASNSYWIGIRRELWTWQSTNSDVKYSEWIAGHPMNEAGRANADCLCLSTNEWKWIECGCNQQLPFACMEDTNSITSSTAKPSTKTTNTANPTPTPTSTTTTTTTRSTTSTSRSTITTDSTTKTASKSVSLTPETNGIPSPAIPSTETSTSTPGANKPENKDRSKELIATEVGVAVGIVIGIPLIIVIVVLAVVIVRLRKELKQLRVALLSHETYKNSSSINRIQQPAGNDTQELRGMTGDQYESLQPRTERTATYDGLYQPLDPSTRMESSVLSSNTWTTF